MLSGRAGTEELSLLNRNFGFPAGIRFAAKAVFGHAHANAANCDLFGHSMTAAFGRLDGTLGTPRKRRQAGGRPSGICPNMLRPSIRAGRDPPYKVQAREPPATTPEIREDRPAHRLDWFSIQVPGRCHGPIVPP